MSLRLLEWGIYQLFAKTFHRHAPPLQYVEKSFVALWRGIPLILVALVLLVNVKLHSGPDLGDSEEAHADVAAQLAYLSRQIHDHRMAERMQRLFPEGFVFTHALYGLTWCELAIADPQRYGEKGLEEARFSFRQIDSEVGRSTFDRDMVPAYGLFYHAWRNYLLAKITVASHGTVAKEVALFKRNSAELARFFGYGSSPFPDSYPEQSWPADACVGMASLALYNRQVGPEFDSLTRNWVRRCWRHRDPESGLLPHKTQSETATMEEGPRGCSSVLNLYFLPDIDPELAVDQFLRFDSLFSQSRLGLPTLREYPNGRSGTGDVDSGPVIWGVGFSATIVGIGAYLRFGETTRAQSLSDAVEALGFSFGWGGRKRYIFGSLPVADAFIAWARVQRPDARVLAIRQASSGSLGSKAVFHLVSMFLVLILLAWRFRKRLKNQWQQSRQPINNA